MTPIKLTVKDEFDGMRLDRFVLNNTKCSKGAVQKLIRKGDVKINKKKANAPDRIKSGDEVIIYGAEVKDEVVILSGLEMPNVIYEDELILAINKPSGLNTQPGGGKRDCLSERVKLYLKDVIAQYSSAFVPAPANRLDNGTSGIVLCGKTPKAAAELSYLIRENKVKKQYLVLVKGKLNQKIKPENYAKKDSVQNMMKPCSPNAEGAVKMAAVYEPIEQSGDYTLVRAKLITGRTHQIRFQLSQNNLYVVGDFKYGDNKTNEEFKRKYNFKRLFLHCCEMSFNMWDGSGNIKISCMPDEELLKILKYIGFKSDLTEI